MNLNTRIPVFLFAFAITGLSAGPTAASAGVPPDATHQMRMDGITGPGSPVLAQVQPPTLPGTIQPRRMAPRRAMLMVIEENEQVSYSVTWRGLAEGVASFDYQDLIHPAIRPQVTPVVNATVAIASTLGLPAATLADEISRSLSRQYARMLGQHAGTVAAQAGLPAGGCAREMFTALADAGVRRSTDPFRAYINTFGERAMADCLKAMADPYYDTVVVLNDSAATFDSFKAELLRLHNSNHVIDILINVHGCGAKSGPNSELNNGSCGDSRLQFYKRRNIRSEATPADIEGIRASNGGQPLNINAVYQVSCWGSDFNGAWLNLGAKAANGARELNYYVLMSPFVFLDRFTRGNRTLREASQDAYLAERNFFNGQPFTARLDLRPFLNRTFPPPSFGIDLIGHSCPGGTRNGCSWSFTPPYSGLANVGFATIYAHDKSRPVNHSASSVRRHQGPSDVRRAAVGDMDAGEIGRLAAR
jgi:hypothetical protein